MARILVIDDEVQVRTMLRQMLERSGYEVMDAEDGEGAIQLHREQPADLIITDIIMPGKEGIATISELLRNFPELKIIAISGGGRIGPEEYLDIARRLGAMRTLTKPIERKELLEAVQELLE